MTSQTVRHAWYVQSDAFLERRQPDRVLVIIASQRYRGRPFDPRVCPGVISIVDDALLFW